MHAVLFYTGRNILEFSYEHLTGVATHACVDARQRDKSGLENRISSKVQFDERI
jgi:hypothetical protein